MTLLQTFFPELYTSAAVDYNLIKTGNSELTLELSVLGIPEENVDVEVSGNKLTVSATHNDDRTYVHNGFAKGSFRRSFNLRDDILVKSASVKNGVLSIVLSLNIPEEQKPKKIPITH